MPNTIEIDQCPIGTGETPYIVAEMSGNHNGEIERAFQILDAAKKAGADAVKIQTYRPDTITIDHSSSEFLVHGGLWDGRRLYELYEEANTPWEWHEAIFEHAHEIGITIFSTPSDPTAVDLLEKLNAPAYKIASPELIDLPLIRCAAQTGKPLIMSTGMANLAEISDAIEMARKSGATDIVILHCTSAYPTDPKESNLATIGEIARRFDVLAGLSDHTLGTTVSAIAIALGACLIEKHFTLKRSEGGVDSAFSIEPNELAELVETARVARVAIGQATFEPTSTEKMVLELRRSLYIVKAVAEGEQLTDQNVRSIRPGLGLKPKYLDQVLGRRATRDLKFGEPLDASMLEGTLAD